jgi:hypothetical protein
MIVKFEDLVKQGDDYFRLLSCNVHKTMFIVLLSANYIVTYTLIIYIHMYIFEDFQL